MAHASLAAPRYLPPLVVAQEMHLPSVLSFAARPGPPLPCCMATGEALPVRCYNPFAARAPSGTWSKVAKTMSRCIASLLNMPSGSFNDVLMIEVPSSYIAHQLLCLFDSALAPAIS